MVNAQVSSNGMEIKKNVKKVTEPAGKDGLSQRYIRLEQV